LLALVSVCLLAGLQVVSAQTPTPTPTATPSPTPDPFVTQITASNTNTFVGGISGNGRFVVFESSADLAAAGGNADGNREIFLYDYAQRRIFQITDTTVARADTTKPAINATTIRTRTIACPRSALLVFTRVMVQGNSRKGEPRLRVSNLCFRRELC